jgi:hypothetical protein
MTKTRRVTYVQTDVSHQTAPPKTAWRRGAGSTTLATDEKVTNFSRGKKTEGTNTTKGWIKESVSYSMNGRPTSFGKGPQQLLWAGSLSASTKITPSYTPNLLNHCASFIVYIEFKHATAGCITQPGTPQREHPWSMKLWMGFNRLRTEQQCAVKL